MKKEKVTKKKQIILSTIKFPGGSSRTGGAEGESGTDEGDDAE